MAASFADFIFGGFLEFLFRLNPKDYEKFVEHDAAFKAHHVACKPWLERDY